MTAQLGTLPPADAETLCELYIGCMRVLAETGFPGRALAALLQVAATRRHVPPDRLKRRGRRRFQALGTTVSMASSTVTMPTRRHSASTTGTASRL